MMVIEFHTHDDGDVMKKIIGYAEKTPDDNEHLIVIKKVYDDDTA